MTSHYQYYKDQLLQFDKDAQEIRAEIDRLYSQLAKVQEARLQFQLMNERIFGEPEQAVVMQHMPTRDGALSRLAKYGQQPQLPYQASPGQVEERARKKKQRDHDAYLRRKERNKRKRPSGPTWVNKVLAFVREAGEPVGYRDILNYHGGDENEAVIKSAISGLKRQGLIQTEGPSGTGHRGQYVPTERGRIVNIELNGASHA